MHNVNACTVVDPDFVFDSQWTLEWLAQEVAIQDVTPFDNSNQPLPPHIGSRVSDENIDHVACDLKPTLVSAKIMAICLLIGDKFRKDMKVIILEDHQWQLRSSDPN